MRELNKMFSGLTSHQMLKEGGIDESMTPEKRMEDYINFMNEPVDEDEIAWSMSEFGPNSYKVSK